MLFILIAQRSDMRCKSSIQAQMRARQISNGVFVLWFMDTMKIQRIHNVDANIKQQK